MGCYCSATNYPPCSYCTSHGLCEGCDGDYDNDELEEFEGFCEDCFEENKIKKRQKEIYDKYGIHIGLTK